MCKNTATMDAALRPLHVIAEDTRSEVVDVVVESVEVVLEDTRSKT